MRIWHWIIGHKLTPISVAFGKPTCVFIGNEEQLHGFTDILFSCACGKIKRRRFTGDHRQAFKVGDVAELEKLFKL